MRPLQKKYLFVLLSLIFAVSCQLDVPIKEMTRAKKTIKRAYEVKADRYAPEDLKKAENKLFASHDSLSNEKAKEARENADDSYQAAKQAIEKSLPLLARDTLDQAKALNTRAINFNCEKYAPADLAAGEVLVTEADSLNTEKKYWDSYLKSIAAIDSFNTAISAAEEAVSALEVTIGKLKAERDDIERQDTKKTAEKELAAALNALTGAENSIRDDMIKDAEQLVNEAEQYIKAAGIKVAILSARDKIALLRASIEMLKNERGTDFAPEEINSALASLNEGESLLDQEKNEEALTKIADAENYYLAALLKTEKGLAEDKIKNAEALLQKVLTADSKLLYQTETGQSATLIQQAKDSYAAQAFRDAITRADEAEKILNSLSISIGREYGAPLVQGEDNVTYYVVRLNVKDRDCLWKIAQRIYKNPRLWPIIYVANKDQIKDPDLIFPGQKFRIPPLPKKETAKPAEGAVNNESAPAAAGPGEGEAAPAPAGTDNQAAGTN